MDKSLRGFLKISLAIILIFFIAIFLFAFFYLYSTLNTYNYILLFLTILTIIIMLLVAFSVFAIFFTYKTKKPNKLLIWLIKLGLKALMPFVIYISKVNKDSIRQLYIDLNNMLVEHTADRKYSPKDILVILPHCLQNSKCQYKVTGAITNCRRCGQCCIGEIAAVSDEIGVTAEIVTGGTAARNIVNVKKPEIILSVACERDLASGISDITGIPVLGIINERPNGPCCNTNVDARLIELKLKSIIDKIEKQ